MSASNIFGFLGQSCPRVSLRVFVQCLSRSVFLERSKSVFYESFPPVSMQECFPGVGLHKSVLSESCEVFFESAFLERSKCVS